MKVYIGLDIGGTKILGAMYGENGNLIKKVKKRTKASRGIDIVVEQIFKVVDGLLEDEEVELLGIGAGAPGIVLKESLITFSPNIPFKEFNLGEIMKERYDVPFVLGNDVNVAIFGEWKAANIEGAKNVLGLFVGTGVGGAIIIEGRLYTGHGGAGEIGHMILNPGGITCGCGSHGCLEAYASKTGMQKAIVAGIRKGRKTVLKEYLESDGAVIKSSSLQRAFEEKDQLAVEVIHDAAYYLGIATANLVNIFHPELIILGGGVMESLGELLLPMIIDEAKRHAMVGMLEDVQFQLSHLSDDAGIYGAYRLIMDHLG